MDGRLLVYSSDLSIKLKKIKHGYQPLLVAISASSFPISMPYIYNEFALAKGMRGYGDHSPPTVTLMTAEALEGQRRSASGGAVVRAEGSQEEHEVGLGASVDGRPMEADMMVLPLAPDEALVVDVAICPDSSSMVDRPTQ